MSLIDVRRKFKLFVILISINMNFSSFIQFQHLTSTNKNIVAETLYLKILRFCLETDNLKIVIFIFRNIIFYKTVFKVKFQT